MNLTLIGFTIDVIGKVLIAFTAMSVHHRFRKEHKIDSAVFKEMKKEQSLGVLGIVLIILGYLLQLPSKL